MQPKRTNADGTWTPLPMLSKAEWADLNAQPMSDWAKRIGTRQITVNSQPRVIVRGRLQRKPVANVS